MRMFSFSRSSRVLCNASSEGSSGAVGCASSSVLNRTSSSAPSEPLRNASNSALSSASIRRFQIWLYLHVQRLLRKLCLQLKSLNECKAQGTTEYAILVGVLVVIAIVAIVAFKDKIQELWSSISDNINSL